MKNIIELFKYIFELFKPGLNIALVALVVILLIKEYDIPVSEISLNGIKIDNNRTDLLSNEIVQIKAFISQLQDKEKLIDSYLENQNKVSLNYIEPKLSKKPPTDSLVEQTIEDKIRDKKILDFVYDTPTEETQLVSNEDAKIAIPIGAKDKTYIKGKTGYMWIGNYDDKWESSRLKKLDGETISIAPEDIKPNNQYRVIGNVYLREDKPKEDESYFRGSKALGIILEDVLITVIEKPIVYQKTKKQYWMKVRVEE